MMLRSLIGAYMLHDTHGTGFILNGGPVEFSLLYGLVMCAVIRSGAGRLSFSSRKAA